MTTWTRHGDVHVGLDVGTSHLKAVAHDEEGRALLESAAATPWHTTASGATETTGAAVVEATLRLLHDLVEALEGHGWTGRVRSVGLTGMGESGVLLDGQGRELAPVVAWFDDRGGAEVAALGRDAADLFAARTGLRLDAQASASKLHAARRAGLDLRAGHQWLSVPEHVAHALGGERVAEPSLASRTGLLDQDDRRESAEVLDLLDLPAGLLPDLVEAGTTCGRVTHPGAPAAVLGAHLTVAGHDHPVAAIGSGATRADQLFNGAGTADVLLRSVPGTVPAASRAALTDHGVSVGAHVLRGAAAVLGGVNNGLVLSRVLTLVGAGDPATRDLLDAEVVARTDLATHGAHVPGVALRGADRHDAVLHLDLSRDLTPAELLTAALERTATDTAALLAVVEAVVGRHRTALCSGGWARMAGVRAVKTRVLAPVTFSPATRPGCRGAAALGALAADGRGQDGLADLVAAWDAADPDGTPLLTDGARLDHPSTAPVGAG